MYDIIIVGGGVAGMTAALYARRNGKTVLILERESIGGQIALSPRVENIPSILQVSGAEYAEKIFEQVTGLGAEFELETVQTVTKSEDIFTVTTDYGAYAARAVILATGVKPRRTGVKGETELVGRGVSYCALCDGAFAAGEEVVLIGDANSALQYALYLSNYCKKVTITALFDKFFGEKHLVDAVLSKSNVEVHFELSLKEFVTDEDGLTALIYTDKNTGKDVKFDCRSVFVAIGQVPDNERYKELADLDNEGYFISDEKLTTKTPGLFVAGDCRTKSVRQLITAAGDGAVAGTSACNYLFK